eukprot:g4899.t1
MGQEKVAPPKPRLPQLGTGGCERWAGVHLSFWSDCDRLCGGGVRYRRRVVVRCRGKVHSKTHLYQQRKACNQAPCNCDASDFACGAPQHVAIPTVMLPAELQASGATS